VPRHGAIAEAPNLTLVEIVKRWFYRVSGM